jgi:hypothetical protein
MDKNKGAESGKGSKILTIRLPAEAAAKMQQPGFVEKLNEEFADAGLPRVESIEPVSPTKSTDSAS